MTGWHAVPVLDAVTDVTGGNAKVPASDYLPRGAFPIIDQGQAPIAGYTDVESLLCRAETPVILFGDHTRTVKYVDSPFVLGADGVKVLKPRPGWDPRYVFWALAALDLPNAGYSRHFKFLREQRVARPPLEEQRRIAAVLDEAGEVRDACRRQLRTAGSLGAALFEDMFGDLLATDGAWKSGHVGDLVESFTSGKNIIPANGDSGDDYFRVLRASAITTGVFRGGDTKPVPAGYQPPDSHLVREGDLLFGRANTSALIGATAFAVGVLPGTLLPDKIWRFVWPPGGHVEPRFVDHLFRSRSFRRELSRRSSGTSGSMKNISQAKVLSIPIGIPPLSLQRRFAEVAERSSRAVTAISLRYEESLELVAALQDRAFKGEL